MARSAAGFIVSMNETHAAEQAFNLALEHWYRQTQINSCRRPPRILNRQISFYLKSTPGKAPERDKYVPQSDLDKAWSIITMFTQRLFNNCPPWPLALYYMGKADYFIRTENLDEGSHSLSKNWCTRKTQA